MTLSPCWQIQDFRFFLERQIDLYLIHRPVFTVIRFEFDLSYVHSCAFLYLIKNAGYRIMAIRINGITNLNILCVFLLISYAFLYNLPRVGNVIEHRFTSLSNVLDQPACQPSLNHSLCPHSSTVRPACNPVNGQFVISQYRSGFLRDQVVKQTVEIGEFLDLFFHVNKSFSAPDAGLHSTNNEKR